MEEGTDQAKVVGYLCEAAKAQSDDPGWGAQFTTEGVRLTYTWLGRGGNAYTAEDRILWTLMAEANENPVISSMAKLLKDKEEHKS